MNNPKAKDNLKPFKKGVDSRRNLDGRTTGVPNSSTRLTRLLELVQRKKNPVTGEIEDFTTIELMDMAQIAKSLKGDTRAYEALLDRLEGKAKQEINQNVTNNELKVTVKRMDK